MLGVNEVKANFQNDCLLKVQFIRFKIETQSLGRVGGICGMTKKWIFTFALHFLEASQVSVAIFKG